MTVSCKQLEQLDLKMGKYTVGAMNEAGRQFLSPDLHHHLRKMMMMMHSNTSDGLSFSLKLTLYPQPALSQLIGPFMIQPANSVGSFCQTWDLKL